MRTLFLSLILTLIFGSAMTAEAQTTSQISLLAGKQKTVTRDKIKIKFVSVEDSRCPQGVDCIWAGNAKVTIKVTNRKGESKTFDLNTNLEVKAVKFEGYEIKLGNVTPYPKANVPISPNGYTAGFTVTKL
jgi:hypothetical protein